MTSISLLTGPVVEPVTLAELKAHARIDADNEDSLLGALITAARQWAERYTNRAFIAQTWRLAMDATPLSEWWDGLRQGVVQTVDQNALILPRAPLISVIQAVSYDETDTPTVWTSQNYFVDTNREPGRLVLRTGSVWPTATRAANGFVVDYQSGYGITASSVPEPIKLAMKQLALHWYEHRGEELMPGSASSEISSRYGAVNVPLLVQALLNPYRVM